MVTVTIFEAKTRLSELLKRAQSGEQVIITSGREKTPVARLEPIAAVRKKRLGVLEIPGFTLSKAFFEPMLEDGLQQCREQVDAANP